MKPLKNNNVLLFCPKFFGYDVEIAKTLKNVGSSIYSFDERPNNSFLMKALIRLNCKKLINNKIHNYYKKIIESIKDKSINMVLIIAPEAVSEKEISMMRTLLPGVKIITYLWDGIANKPNSLNIAKLSDKAFSFDHQDAKQHECLKFLPLFYIDDYKQLTLNSQNKEYDITFIGTIHSDRYRIVKEIEQQNNGKLNIFSYFYCPHPLVFLYKKYITKELSKVNSKDVTYIPLNKKQLLNIIAKSNSIIDIEHNHQTGLTMRTIEMLGARKKLITTNQLVKNYDFYYSNNINVIDRNKPILDIDFLKEEYQPLANDLYQKYSLSNWLLTLLKND